jgi:hypothetical protein
MSTDRSARLLTDAQGERAARLMTDGEVAHLESLNQRIQALDRAPHRAALLTASIAAMSAGLVLPSIGVIVAAALTFLDALILVGFGASESGFAALAGTTWLAVFSLIPVWGWIALGAVVAVGAAGLVYAVVSDAPRRRELAALRAERQALVASALSRPAETSMIEVPMLPLATF